MLRSEQINSLRFAAVERILHRTEHFHCICDSVHIQCMKQLPAAVSIHGCNWRVTTSWTEWQNYNNKLKMLLLPLDEQRPHVKVQSELLSGQQNSRLRACWETGSIGE